MQLVVDASTLVAEGLRQRGRDLLARPELELELVITTEVWGETHHELRRRTGLMVQRVRLTERAADYLLQTAFRSIQADVTVMPPDKYAAALGEAARCVPRDPRDAPTVALALTLGCGILTSDCDFFGCGVAVWTVETLALHLDAAGSG